VIDQVKAKLPMGWQASLLAVDGNLACDVIKQLKPWGREALCSPFPQHLAAHDGTQIASDVPETFKDPKIGKSASTSRDQLARRRKGFVFTQPPAVADIGFLAVNNFRRLVAGVHDSLVSRGPVQRRPEVMHGIRQRAHS
jgi:hypothetical protein